MKDLGERENVREHGEEPRNGVEVRSELDRVEVNGELRVVERDQVRELRQVFVYHCRVVLEEEPSCVLVNERCEAGECARFVVEVKVEEGCA
jgi:hypothetical protein